MKEICLWAILFLSPFAAETEPRTWTLSNGCSVEADFVHVMGEQVVLRSPSGRTAGVKLEDLSADDRVFIELASPPDFEVSFRRKTKQKYYSSRFGSTLLPEIERNTFGVKVWQTGAGEYHHELRIELFVIGKERAGDRFILLDRRASTFMPGSENSRSHEFWGRTVELDKYEIFYIDQPRGKKYAGHLILVTDVRGEVVASRATQPWLIENLDKLKLLPVGAYMDKSCKRTFPTRPKPCRY